MEEQGIEARERAKKLIDEFGDKFGGYLQLIIRISMAK